MDYSKILNLMDNMGPPPANKEAPKAPQGMLACSCGKKFIPWSEVKMCRTKIVPSATDSICDECHRWAFAQSKVICLKCKAVVARIEPHKDKSGFVFERGASYHTDSCPNCMVVPVCAKCKECPGIGPCDECRKNVCKSTLLEKHFYDQERK